MSTFSRNWDVGVSSHREVVCPVAEEKLKEKLLFILSELAEDPLPEGVCELSVVLTNDREIQELNKSFRDKDKPTDVLSFSQLEGENLVISHALGDVVVSIETAQRQAEQIGHSLEDELYRLLVHGVLHLFGYDHEDVPEAEAQRMKDKEDEILSKLYAE